MKTYWGVNVQLHAFLTSTLYGGEWSASRPSRFTPREKTLDTHGIRGWVGLRAVLDAVVNRNRSNGIIHDKRWWWWWYKMKTRAAEKINLRSIAGYAELCTRKTDIIILQVHS
jgi:hypothetical protein